MPRCDGGADGENTGDWQVTDTTKFDTLVQSRIVAGALGASAAVAVQKELKEKEEKEEGANQFL